MGKTKNNRTTQAIPGSSVSVAPNPCKVGTQYTISGSGYSSLPVNCNGQKVVGVAVISYGDENHIGSPGIQQLEAEVLADGTFNATSYAGVTGPTDVEIHQLPTCSNDLNTPIIGKASFLVDP